MARHILPRVVRVVLPSAAVLAAALAVAESASAQVLRYSATTNGGIVATGNTLGLSKETGKNGPGTRDSIGTFISLDSSSVDNQPADGTSAWPAGTTWDWTKSGSRNTLALPQYTEVRYAELVWAGSYKYVDDVTAYLDNPVTLSAGGQSVQVSPDSSTAITVASTAASGFAVNYYMRSAEVTNFVKQHGAASYAVEGVPATQNEAINSLNASGWTLVVAYAGEGLPSRNLSIFVGGSFVDENSQQDYSVSGFCAPAYGQVDGSVIISALEGDANLTGDQLLIGATTGGSFAQLSGPNNPANNFFCSQINDAKGQLDTGGSFGNRNQDAKNGINISGGRQGWDLTTVPVSSASGQLSNGQKSAVIRTITTGDSYMPVLAAFDIDVTSPDFAQNSDLVSNVSQVKQGDSMTLTATLKNAGDVPANISFVLPLDPALGLTSFTSDGNSGDINGAPVTAASLGTGVDEGTLAVGAQRTVQIVLQANGAPKDKTNFMFSADWAYDYVTCPGKPAVNDDWPLPLLQVAWQAGVDAGSGGQGGTSGAGGAAGSGGASGSGGTSGSGGAAGGAAGSGASGGSGGSAAGGAAGSGAGGSATGGSAGASSGGATGDSGVAGYTGNAGTTGSGAGSNDTGGCSCELPGSRRTPAPLALLLGVLGAVGVVRRRRR